MATVTAPARAHKVAESQTRVQHPLRRLSTYIRTYVTAEVATALCLYLVVGFWVGLALDYGAFWLFGFDFAQEWPRWPRIMILGLALAGVLCLVEFQVHRRVFKTLAKASESHKSPVPLMLEIAAAIGFAVLALLPLLLVPARIGEADDATQAASGATLGVVFLLDLLAITGGILLTVPAALRRLRVGTGLAWTIGGTAAGLGVAVFGLYTLSIVLDSGTPAARLLAAGAWTVLLLGVAGLTMVARRRQILAFGMLLPLAVFWAMLIPGWVVALVLGFMLSYNLLRLVGLRWQIALAAAPLPLLYLFLWAYAGLWLDTHFLGDWEPWVVGFAVAGLLLVLVVAMVARRLLYDFSPASLALLLERRFPDVLGDRLITAVELADVKKSARYGYSREMIEQTIIEAAERVDKVPVGEVFRWGRLFMQVLVIGILSAGAYLLVGGTASAFEALDHRPVSLAGYHRLNENSAYWFERNILLQNVLWPRRAYLELVGFPESGEKRVPQGTAEMTVRVRALKWVVADRSAPEGWRALTWNDQQHKDLESLLGTEPPALPKRWIDRRTQVWTVDEVDLELSRPETDTLFAIHELVANKDQLLKNEQITMGMVDGREQLVFINDIKDPKNRQPLTWAKVRSVLGEDKVPALPPSWFNGSDDARIDQVEAKLAEYDVPYLAHLKKDVLQRLGEIAESGEHKNSFRRLIIPSRVLLSSWGRDTRDYSWLDKLGESNEYEGKFKQLKESFTFRVRGEDYSTRAFKVVVVPPPSLLTLLNEAEHPAYLYYRIPEGATAEEFKKFRQKIVGRLAPVSGAETRLDVPAGSNLTLTATADKDLTEVGIEPAPKAEVRVNAPVVQIDYRRFQVRLENIRTQLDFYFAFTDTDGVHNRRRIVVTPVEDREPEPAVGVEVVRKTNQGYMVTPVARIPFGGKISDDRGLDKVEFSFLATRLDASSEAAERFLELLAPLYQLSGGIDQSMAAAGRFLERARAAGKEKPKEESPGLRSEPMIGFKERLASKRRNETLPLEELRPRLHRPGDPHMKEGQKGYDKEKVLAHLLNEYNVDAKNPADGFDLQPLGLQVADPAQERQPRYRVQVWVDAVDTDVETGPHRARSKESFVFLVVSENELLVEMAREQETLHIRLDDATEVLRKALVKMDQAVLDLKPDGLKADDLPKGALPANIEQQLDKSRETVNEIKEAFDRLIEEAKVNRVRKDYVEKLEKTIAEPLDAIGKTAFPQAKDAMGKFRETLDDNSLALPQKIDASRKSAANARDQLQALIDQLKNVLEGMERVADINALIKQIRAIEEDNNRQRDVMAKLQKQLRDAITNKLFGDEDKPEEKKKPDEKK
jgi:hypothetical protein